MVKVEAGITVNVPIGEVFASACDPEIHLQWETTTIKLEKLSEGPMGKAARHRGSVKFLGKVIDWESVVSEFIPESRVEYNICSGSMQFKEIWLFEEIGQDTRVRFIFKGNLSGLLQLISPVAVHAWRRQAVNDLSAMKKTLELKSNRC